MQDLSQTPHATWKQRVVAGCALLILLLTGWDGWNQLQRDFTLSHVIGWMLIFVTVLYAPRLVMTVVFGTMSRSVRFMLNPASYGKTFSETQSQVARELEEERKRSREM